MRKSPFEGSTTPGLPFTKEFPSNNFRADGSLDRTASYPSCMSMFR
jgi:hypothetical protein